MLRRLQLKEGALKWIPHHVYMVFCSVSILAQGTWKLINEIEDPELKDLSSRLPNTTLHSCVDNTVKKYRGVFRRWKTWEVAHKLIPIPAKPHEVVLYLQYLGEKSGSKSAAEEACNVLSWVHSTSGLASPATHPLVKATLESLQCSLVKLIVKKEPMTMEMIEDMVLVAEQSGPLSDLSLTTACVQDS